MTDRPDAVGRLCAAGDYLRQQRVAAELTVAEVAGVLTISAAEQLSWCLLIAVIERGACLASQQTLDLLHAVFAFDSLIYFGLARGSVE